MAQESLESMDLSKMNASLIKDIWEAVFDEISTVIIGQKKIVESMMIGILSRGHVLLEGVPGVAKTQMTNAFSAAMGCTFKRVQFTPDLLPSDIVGSSIYNPKEHEFEVRQGPIFTNILLADEINRAPPRTQAALLEAMAEGQVSLEGVTYPLDSPFMVIATQNPVEQEGTYPLPEAQVDRFHSKVIVDLPSAEEELQIIHLRHTKQQGVAERVISTDILNSMISYVEKNIYISDDILIYVKNLVLSTRRDARFVYGASPRCSIALLETAKALAALRGREYVIPDDVKRVAQDTVAHRLQLKPEIELEGVSSHQIVRQILTRIPVPV